MQTKKLSSSWLQGGVFSIRCCDHSQDRRTPREWLQGIYRISESLFSTNPLPILDLHRSPGSLPRAESSDWSQVWWAPCTECPWRPRSGWWKATSPAWSPGMRSGCHGKCWWQRAEQSTCSWPRYATTEHWVAIHCLQKTQALSKPWCFRCAFLPIFLDNSSSCLHLHTFVFDRIQVRTQKQKLTHFDKKLIWCKTRQLPKRCRLAH